MLVYIVYRPNLTVDLKIFLSMDLAQLHSNHLKSLNEPSKIAKLAIDDALCERGVMWVIVTPEGPRVFADLPLALGAGLAGTKPAMAVISRPVFNV